MPEVQLMFEWDVREAVTGACSSPRWDFKQSFPSPRPEALAAGLLGYDEVDEETIRGVHDEQARHLLALLRDLDVLAEASHTQTDPFTGKKPRTEKQRARLRETLAKAPIEVQREIDEAMEAYANVFGDEAADAFRAAILSWHKIAVPCETPLPQATDAPLACDVTSRVDHYDPGHPWHYLTEGDGATPMPAEQIPAGICTAEQLGVKVPANPAKRAAMLNRLLAEQREQLSEDIARYNDVLLRGADVLSGYDREIAYGGNDCMAVACTIALKFNHIAAAKGRVEWLVSQLLLGRMPTA